MYIKKYNQILIYLFVFFFHFAVLFSISLAVQSKKESIYYFKDIEFVNLKEYKQPQEKIIKRVKIEEGTKEATDDKVEQKQDSSGLDDSDYLSQFQVSIAPIFPEKLIKQKIIYPPLANKQGIVGEVILLLYIDQYGLIREAKVLKDPGYGFAEAAVKAIKGIKCIPATKDGIPSAVMYRYKIKFTLK